MNNLKYNLEIIGEKTNYTPHKEILDPIINSDKKIFEITADNSYGKTFILNLIAYALNAEKLDRDRILPSIKESISRYDDQDAYNLDYTIDLDLPDNKKLTLTKEKGRGKLVQIDNGAPISHNMLHKDLSIIYDVPTNPSERLNAVIKDLGVWNENLMLKFNKISRNLNDIIKEFDSVRNEEKIISLREKSLKYKNEIELKENKLNSKIIILKELNKLSNLRQLSSYLKIKFLSDTEVVKRTKAFKALKKPIKIEKKDELKIKQIALGLTNVERDFRMLISKLINFINSDNEIVELITENKTNAKHYDCIKETEIKEIILSDDYVVVQDKYIKSVEHIKNEVLMFINEKKSDKSYVINHSYTQFITLLENLIDNDIDYLLKTATTVDSSVLKTQLEVIIKEHKIKDYDSIKKFFRDELKPLKGLFAQYYRSHNAWVKESKKKLVNDTDSEYYELEAKLKEAKDKLKRVNSNVEITRGVCAKELNIDDLSKFDSLDKISNLEYNVKEKISNNDLSDNLSSSISNTKKEIEKLEKTKKDLEIEKRITDITYDKENAKNPSKYNDEQKNKIKTFSRIVRTIITNTSNFKTLISNIENGDLSKFKKTEDIRFIEIAGKIIAYSMDNKLLRKDGEFVELKFYDMVKQEFHCSDDLIIKKDDVSTGLASANYLKQRIENVEGKYVVVLLDEIGNMAQNALDKVIESIKKLETQNRLVLAVFTRPNSNGIKIIDY
ncbi:AAA family ATPase [Olleya namhaensis]|uniref:AAA domain-containing protein n=1 Tax=Olleya namhaensis TaxID=1144750 RepID=A0A1I3IP59_9FLAO|nr:AAA family ATPase [Olleya namhaensis]SFI49751.1 AAA domain-containing protein [Olleya namhaensis]